MTRSYAFRFVAIILAIFLGSTPNAYSFPDIDEEKEQIRKRDRELLQLGKKRRNLEQDESIFIGEVKELEQQLRTLDMEIYKHKQGIVQIELRAAQLKAIVQSSKQKIGRRLCHLYLQRDAQYLAKADTTNDFLTRICKIYQLMRQDRNLIAHFEENFVRLENTRRTLSVSLSKLQNEKEYAGKMLATLAAQMTESERNRSMIDSKCTQLENENERAHTATFNLVKGVIEKARKREIQQEPTLTEKEFYWPVDAGPVTSSFGYRFDPVQKVNRLHRGIDIGGAFGTPIKAAAAGRVIESRPSNGYGYIVVLYHGNGVSTLYAHMYGSTVTVSVGDLVHKGKVIALVGSNGWSTGPHLHFEVIEGGQAKDPITYFSKRSS